MADPADRKPLNVLMLLHAFPIKVYHCLASIRFRKLSRVTNGSAVDVVELKNNVAAALASVVHSQPQYSFLPRVDGTINTTHGNFRAAV